MEGIRHIIVLMLEPLPNGISCCLGQVSPPHPDVALWRTGEIFTPDLIEFLRKVRIYAIRIERLHVLPDDNRGCRVDVLTRLFADRQPFLNVRIPMAG